MIHRRRSRKGYVMTLEAFLAFFITFIFVVFVVLKGISAKPAKTQLDILEALEERDDFRTCVYENNVSCIEDLVRPFVPGTYMFRINIDSPSVASGAKDIYSETVFLAGNSTGEYKTVYLYYWPKSG
jgi:hypothetical protein